LRRPKDVARHESWGVCLEMAPGELTDSERHQAFPLWVASRSSQSHLPIAALESHPWSRVDPLSNPMRKSVRENELQNSQTLFAKARLEISTS
jgi:hypothetical protein